MQLREYQQSAIDGLREGFKDGHKHQVLSLATAGGKTVIAAQIIKNATEKGKRCWFVVDGIELIEQTLETLDVFGIDAGVMQGAHEKTAYAKNVQVMTVQTITRRWNVIDKNPQWQPDLIIADEIHVFYKGHKEMMRMFTDIPFIGITATVWAKGLGKHFTNVVVGATTAQLIESGHLCNYEAYASFAPDMRRVKIQAGEYNPKEVDEKVNTKEIVGDVVAEWLKHGENRQTIAFAANVAHSKAIAEEFLAKGVNAYHVDGYTDKEVRALKIRQFKSGDIKILVNCQIAVKGFNAPSATCLIIAKPCLSTLMHVQILGRILRVSPCGKDALILDFSGNLQRMGMPDDDWPTELNDGSKKDAKEQRKDEIERELKAPKPCVQCGFLHSVFTCPQCGFEFKKPSEVVALEGELKKLEAKNKTPAQKRHAEASKSDKQKMWSAFLQVGNSKGHSSHLYKDYYGVWPKGLHENINLATAESLIAADKFRAAKQIRYANRRNK